MHVDLDRGTRGDHATSFPDPRLASFSWRPGPGPRPEPGLKSALDSIKPGQILEHIKVLASDEFEGRGPGTAGEEKTVAYLTAQFQKMGLKPGNPDGTFVQDVPLVGFQAKQVTGAFRGRRPDESVCRFPTISWPSRGGWPRRSKVENSDVVFVGYGVVAPEYGWDDYKGLDVRGKTLIMLVNDPPVADPKDPSKLDPAFFKGRAMTYYGRWTYKYEIASEKGATAAILVHETGPAGYPFEVVRGSWSRENFDIAQPQSGQAPSRVAVEGWITLEKARELFQAAGRDFDALKQAAARRDFRPVPLEVQRAVRDHQRAARGQVAERRRPDRGGRSRAQERDIDLHRPLGPSRARPGAEGRPDLQRGGRQRLGRRRRSWRSPTRSPRSNRPRSDRSCSWPSPPRRKDCSVPSTTPRIRSIRSNARWPTSTST